jgi:dTDP-4-amino-4,6-dideoxygalactose transaminase
MMGLGMSLAMGPEAVVLLPAYVPEGLFAPFKHLGCPIVLYPLDENLDPLWAELEELLLIHGPSLAVIIHYYGLEKDSQRFAELCHRYQTRVMEDMAHVLPGQACPLGQAGDFVLYSQNKVIGVPDGGVLVCRSVALVPMPVRFHGDFRRYVYFAQQMALLLIVTASRRFGSGRWLVWVRLLTGPFLNSYRTLMAYYTQPHRASCLTRWLLRHSDWDGWSAERRAHAEQYANGLDPQTFRRLGRAFAPGSGPFGYPVLVQNRDGLRQHLAEKGIAGSNLTPRWDFIPSGERHKHPDAVAVLDRHFLFPTAQGLSSEEVACVIVAANEWAKTQGKSAREDDGSQLLLQEEGTGMRS